MVELPLESPVVRELFDSLMLVAPRTFAYSFRTDI